MAYHFSQELHSASSIIDDSGLAPKKNHIFQVTGHNLQQLFNRSKKVEARLEFLEKKLKGVKGVLHDLCSEADSGIMGDSRDLKRREKNFKSNEKPALGAKISFCSSFIDALDQRIYFVLAICVLISIVTGMVNDPKLGWVKGVSILVGLLILVSVTSLSDYEKDKRFVQMSNLAKEEYLPVLRGKKGATQTVNVWDLVVGDVVLLDAGDMVPADCLLLEGSPNLRVDEESLLPVVTRDEEGEEQQTWPFVQCAKSSKADPFLLAGSRVLEGSATALVSCVGINSSRREPDKLDLSAESGLQEKLKVLANNFTLIGIVAALVILVQAIIVLAVAASVNKEFDTKMFIQRLMDSITLSIVLIIVAIPDGLPMVVTMSLAFSVSRMYDNDGVLVKDVNKTELLGQVSEVCLGKTCTLTTDEMTVQRFYIQSLDRVNSRKNTFINCNLDESQIDLVSKSIVFNSSVYIEMTPNALYEPLGNGTEVSMFKWLQQADIPVHELIKQKGDVKLQLPFDTNHRRSIVAIQQDGFVRVYVKGAPELIIARSSHYHSQLNVVTELSGGSDTDHDYLLNTMLGKNYTKGDGLRTIALAYRDLSPQQFQELASGKDVDKDMEALTDQLVFLALIGLDDPLRENIEQLVKFVQGDVGSVDPNAEEQAGRKNITMRLVSGDHLETVRRVAEKAGLIQKEQTKEEERQAYLRGSDPQLNRLGYGATVCMSADDLFERCKGINNGVPNDMQKFQQLMCPERDADALKVVARATPKEKAAIVAGLKQLGSKVVAVGDGLNDVKALSTADVSFAMGSGCCLAREAATMVLISDEFKSLTKSILWGRNIYVNVKRFLTFQISCNFSALLVVFIGYFYLQESPLNAIQLLWINLIMDTMAALALATTPPFTKIMSEGVNDDKVILDKIDWRQIGAITTWNVIVMCIVIFAGPAIYDIPYLKTDEIWGETEGGKNKTVHMTLIFNTFVFLQFFNQINCRVVGAKDFNVFTRFFCNWTYVLILVLIFAMQWLTNTRVLFWLFGTTPVTAQEFWSTFVLGATALVGAFLVKLTPRRWAERIKPPVSEARDITAGNKLMAAYQRTQGRVSVMVARPSQAAPRQDASFDPPLMNDDNYQPGGYEATSSDSAENSSDEEAKGRRDFKKRY